MTCEHCGFSCTHEGEDMNLEVFRLALGLDDYVTIGGGEPTIHPKFWEMFGLSIGTVESTFIVTNGSMTEISLKLLKISKASENMFGVELSLDPFHDSIDYKVEKAFREAKRVRDVFNKSGNLAKSGRAKEFFDETEFHEYCICDDLIVEPNGNIKFCGCDDAPIVGSVFAGIEGEYEEWRNEFDCQCWKDVLKEKENAA